jgi:hypothetical protein
MILVMGGVSAIAALLRSKWGKPYSELHAIISTIVSIFILALIYAIIN